MGGMSHMVKGYSAGGSLSSVHDETLLSVTGFDQCEQVSTRGLYIRARQPSEAVL